MSRNHPIAVSKDAAQTTPPNPALAARLESERRGQVAVLLVLASAILMGAVLTAGAGNVFLPGWWRIDLPW